MLDKYQKHNLFRHNIDDFLSHDPQLARLAKLAYQHSPDWWTHLNLQEPGIYILTGGRQVGKSTSCKLLIQHCLQQQLYSPACIFYLPCDEIFDAKELSQVLRLFLEQTNQHFLLIIDEITYVKDWQRVIKALADEGQFTNGFCLLTGSDTLILKEAAMSFPGRRGNAPETDFHLYPLTFAEYVNLVHPNEKPNVDTLQSLFKDYLQSGGYLRAINDLKQSGEILEATYLTYEQWIRGDFLKQNKNEEYLLTILNALITVNISPISYSALTQKIGLISKDTCIDYCNLLERMDILLTLQAFDQNKKQGFPRKDRKFHFFDPFIYRTIHRWLQREGLQNSTINEPSLIEAIVASHCTRFGKTFYFKGQGEVDVILLQEGRVEAIEVKWANQIRVTDLKMLKQFQNNIIVTKSSAVGEKDGIKIIPVYRFLYDLNNTNSINKT